MKNKLKAPNCPECGQFMDKTKAWICKNCGELYDRNGYAK
jgi:ribosomal protein L37AE/L43A